MLPRLREFGTFLRRHKWWWIGPVLAVVGGLLALAWLTGDPALGPTLYWVR